MELPQNFTESAFEEPRRSLRDSSVNQVPEFQQPGGSADQATTAVSFNGALAMRSDTIKLPSYDALIEEAGGFGTFQKLAMLILITSVCASGWAVYG